MNNKTAHRILWVAVAILSLLSIPVFAQDAEGIIDREAFENPSNEYRITQYQLTPQTLKKYPEYGFDRHRGYPTAKHRQALIEHGPIPEHRLSFRPVREAARNFGLEQTEPKKVRT